MKKGTDLFFGVRGAWKIDPSPFAHFSAVDRPAIRPATSAGDRSFAAEGQARQSAQAFDGFPFPASGIPFGTRFASAGLRE